MPANMDCRYCRLDPAPPHGHARYTIRTVSPDDALSTYLLRQIRDTPAPMTSRMLILAAITAGYCKSVTTVLMRLRRLERLDKVWSSTLSYPRSGRTKIWGLR